MAAGVQVVARRAASIAGVANGVDANRVALLSVVLPGEAAVRAVARLADADLASVMRKEVFLVGEWLACPADRVCSQVWLRAGFLLRWVAWRVQA